MNVHKNARMTVHGRLLMVQRVLDEGRPVAVVAGELGVSLRTVRKWLARYRAGGERALGDRSSAPASCPHRTDESTVARILELRRERLSGPRIARRLGVATSTVGAILRRRGQGRLPPCEPPAPAVRYERRHPGELVHLDVKKLGRIDGIGHRITGDRRGRRRRAGWEYLHVAIDDHARLAYTEILADERGGTCAAFLAHAVACLEACGVAVQRVMTDNAFAYTQSHAFQATLRAIGARHLTTRPYRPRTNGKSLPRTRSGAERFIQTCLREWLYARPYPTSHARTAAMPDWLHTYNHHRPHAGLKGLTPVQRLNNVLGNDS